MELFSYLLNEKHQAQIKLLIEKITPYLFQEWHNIEPKVKVLIRRARPHAEKKFDNLVKEVEGAAATVDQDFSNSVKDIFVMIEEGVGYFSGTLSSVLKSNDKVNEFITNLSKSAANVEGSINYKIDNMKSEQYLLFEELGRFENILEKIDSSTEDFDVDLMSYTKSETFRETIINNCTVSNFIKERTSRIEEILDLHCLGFYGGSIALLYSQIEGVITDALVKSGHAKITKRNTVVHIGGKESFPGLSKKMEYTGGNIECFENVFNKLLNAKFLDGDKARSISQARNIILHGNFVELSDKHHSLCLLLTLYVITIKIRLISN